jgi:hypothetical protein
MTSNDDGCGNGTSRRRVLECMTWVGTGLLWTVTGGVPRSLGLVDQAIYLLLGVYRIWPKEPPCRPLMLLPDTSIIEPRLPQPTTRATSLKGDEIVSIPQVGDLHHRSERRRAA